MGRHVVRSKETSTAALVESFIRMKRVAKCVESTLKIYGRWLGELAIIVPNVADLDADRISQLMEQVQRPRQQADGHVRQLRDNTVQQVWRTVKVFVRWLVKTGTIPADPMLTLTAPRIAQQRQPVYSDGDFEALLGTCGDRRRLVDCRDYAMMLVLADSGIRRAELCGLKLSDYQAPQVTVRQGKGRKDRVTFVGPETVKAVAEYLMLRPPVAADADAPLFADITGQPIQYRHLYAIVARRCVKAGIPQWGIHALRRRAITGWIRNGMGVHHAQRLAGHAHLATTERYLALLPDDLRKAHEQANAVGNFLASMNGHQEPAKSNRQIRAEQVAAARREMAQASA